MRPWEKALSRLLPIVAIASISCESFLEDVERSAFLILYSRGVPLPPDCDSPGDASFPTQVVDLVTATSPEIYLEVLNQAHQSITIDHMDIRMSASGQESDWQRHAFSEGIRIPMESQQAIYLPVLTDNLLEELDEGIGCAASFPAGSTPQDNFPFLSQMIESGDTPLPYSADAYVSVILRLVGKTVTGLRVATPDYRLELELGCNTLVDWSHCTDYCSALCAEPQDDELCTPGIGNNYQAQTDCRAFFHDPGATWSETADGGVDPEEMSCDDCPS
jgi:hypothetical protein